MLGSNGEKYHISNVDVKFYSTLSINNTHLREKNYVYIKHKKSNIH